jgi:hypothetical protein
MLTPDARGRLYRTAMVSVPVAVVAAVLLRPWLLFALPPLLVLASVVGVVATGIVEGARPRRALPAPDPEVWCECGSAAPGVPVEVHDGPDGTPEVVGHLCPGCREKRRPPTPKEARIAAQRARTADVFGLTPKPDLPNTDGDSIDGYCGFCNTEGHKAADCTALQQPCAVCGKPGMHYTHQHRRPAEPLTVPGPYDADPAPPVVEVEQGGWIYSLAWHVDIEDLCEDGDHEWESLRTGWSSQPVFELCGRCGVKRRPAGGADPDMVHPVRR